MPPSSVHFNGSVNLPDAGTVMREISSRIPTGVRRMTDGETGDRNYWIHFQIQKFLHTGRFKILSQSGTLQKGRTVPRPEFGEAAMFAADPPNSQIENASGQVPQGTKP